MNHVPDLCAESFPLAFSCNRLPSVFFPRPGTSFGESVLLLFGERNATARDWVATLRRWFMEDRGENFPPRSVRRVVGSSVALLGLSATPEACGGTSHFPICPHISSIPPIEKYWIEMWMFIIQGIPWCPPNVCSNQIMEKSSSEMDPVSRGARAYGMEGMQAQGWVWTCLNPLSAFVICGCVCSFRCKQRFL